MKKLLVTTVALLLMVGCAKEELKNDSQDTKTAITKQSENPTDQKFIDPSEVEAEMKLKLEANTARLAALPQGKSCNYVVLMPLQYTTLQEAIDNVCENGTIYVISGNYTEQVVITTKGINIVGRSSVTLTGNFTVAADNVSIYNFNIDSEDQVGINAYGVKKGKIIGNTITGTGETGIRYFDGSKIVVKNNHVSGKSWGIFFGSGNITGESHNNKIINNTVTGITAASVIGLQGNCDYNLISKNNLFDNPAINNAGIMLYSFATINACDNNTITKNTVTNSINGLWIFNGGENNSVGGQNNLNSNINYGFYIDGDATDNHIFDNNMQNNTVCDIGNYANNPAANTFVNNTYDCIEP